MVERIANKITVGITDGQVGWIIEYAEGSKEAFKFNLPTAKGFVTSLTLAIEQLENALQEQVWRDNIGVGEEVRLRLVDPEDDHG